MNCATGRMTSAFQRRGSGRWSCMAASSALRSGSGVHVPHYTEGRFRLSTTVSRPLRADAARNRERILDAARAAFSELGGGVQMEDVARRAGVGVGTLYRHFPTKAALVGALADRRWEETLERLDAEALAATDPWDGFAQMFHIAGELQQRDRNFAEAVTDMYGGLCAGPPAA